VSGFIRPLQDDPKSITGSGGTLAAPVTAYLYDWNMLPLGQLLWMKELASYKEFPPLQAPETYNLDGIMAEMAASRASSHAGE
jgi:arylsulfatase